MRRSEEGVIWLRIGSTKGSVPSCGLPFLATHSLQSVLCFRSLSLLRSSGDDASERQVQRLSPSCPSFSVNPSSSAVTMANATQFIGSKISLISKSEIRYEGILYSLDVVEATISLAKVKSYGTEDRPTERPVPPKDEIYEFIIFRGADIKGIDVVEPPKGAASVNDGIPNDPAIVEVSHYHTSGRGSSSAGPSGVHGSFNQHGVPVYGAVGGSGSKPVSQTNSLLDGLLGRSNASTPYGSRKSPLVDAGTQSHQNERQGQGRGNRRYNNENREGGARGGEGGRNGGGRGGRGYGQGRGGGNQQGQGVERQGGYQPRGRGNYNNSRGGNDYQQNQYRGGGGNFRGGRGGGFRGNRTEGILKAPQTAKVTFDQPFDFEKANEELLTAIKELKIGEVKEGEETQDSGSPAAMLNHVEAEEQENKEPGTFYKKDNFFDSISCEALERGKGPANRVDWKAERKLNAETFGLTGNGGQRRGGYYYRGGGGGGGGNNYGRGYYRGGYGYGGNRGGYQSRGGYGGGYSSYNNRYNGGGGGRGRDRDGNGQGSF